MSMNDKLAEAIKRHGFDANQAAYEGWNIFECGPPRVGIQKIDDMDRFETDYEAICHVVERARQGSPNHVAALRVINDTDRYTQQDYADVTWDALVLWAEPARMTHEEDEIARFWRTMLALLLVLTGLGLVMGLGAAWAMVGWEKLDGSGVTITALTVVAWAMAMRLTRLNFRPDAPWSDMLPRWMVRMWRD